ncbi:hypothetical protein F0562_000519 [Nyssa sinensis]|uniref:Protein kinase domain-containing protein n=1 Tax=Nyssa sinensis TaxID=561372 RepID=A0A5J5C0D1_9ASTE|nr:hypothetical protein F0562_000519 [Nyssa sinensis]
MPAVCAAPNRFVSAAVCLIRGLGNLIIVCSTVLASRSTVAHMVLHVADNRTFKDRAQSAVVLKETLEALVYLHKHCLLHQGIKLGNIFIDSNGSVKLSNFGVSSSISE